MRTKSVLAFLGAATLAAGAAFVLAPVGRAQEIVPVTAYIGGVDTKAKSASEIVLSNLTSSSFTLNLVLRDTDGTAIVDRPGEITLNPRQTKAVDILEQLRRGLPLRTKPYAGILTVEVSGDPPFSEETVLVHVTQYYGPRKTPRAAFVLRPLVR